MDLSYVKQSVVKATFEYNGTLIVVVKLPNGPPSFHINKYFLYLENLWSLGTLGA